MSDEVNDNLLLIAGGIEGIKMVLDGLFVTIDEECGNDDDDIKREILKEIEKDMKMAMNNVLEARKIILFLLKIKTNSTN